MPFESALTINFTSCVAERPVDLTRAAALIAAHATPDLDPRHVVTELDAIADGVAPGGDLADVLAALFSERGFRGAADDYYNPDNSNIGRVLERRRGNPITLSVITVAVAQRCGIALAPVAMPGHFLVRYDRLDGQPQWIDCFDRGRLLDPEACRQLFEKIAGAGVRFDPSWLDPTPGEAVVARMLNNLVAVHDRTGDLSSLRWSALLRALVGVGDNAALAGYADRVGSAGHVVYAAQIHDALARSDPDQDQAAGLRWWARLN